MKTKSTLFAIFILFTGYLAAQSSVEIKDILVQPIVGMDSVISNYQLEIMFKMNHPENANLLKIQVGTSQDLNDITLIQVQIIEENGLYYTSFNDELEVINGYESRVFIELSESQKETYNVITLFVEDNNGEVSNKLYFRK
ncbi:MAG: hypothetical protein PHZ24_08810 [Bacteroidales bacterium]|nr:hypothetical protein [Bacteroidales bacterium]MDY0142686.1 hypothetical protein [Bacteroidales bacterium]